MKSAKLESMPDNIIILDCHNYAGVMTKVAKALSRRFNVLHIMTGTKRASRLALNGFSRDPKNTLILLSEPGTLVYEPNKKYDSWLYPKIGGIKRPPEIPFGIWWSGSVYRVSNYVALKNVPSHHAKWFVNRRNYFNSLTPFKLVGTDCLIPIDRSAYYVGQPMVFPKSPPLKDNSMEKIIHVASADSVTDFFKGTDKIKKAFKSIKKFMRANIVKGVTHDEVMNKMKNSTMYVLTITDWPSGIGYTGIEALTNGCLLFSKNTGYIDTPIVNVEDSEHLVKSAWYYHDNKKEGRKKAKEQFEWAKKNFSNKAFCKNFEMALKDCIKKGWKV